MLELGSMAKVMGGRAVRRIVFDAGTIHARVAEMGREPPEWQSQSLRTR